MASMVGGLDLHRRQITFEIADTDSGEVWRGKLWQPDRQRLRRWLTQDVAARAKGQVELAVEGCTGWRFVVEEIIARAMWRIWPSRPRRWRRGAASGEPRRTAATRVCYASCYRMAICPRAGSRRRSSWSGGNGFACTRRWSISAPSGWPAFTPSAKVRIA
jgi:hypothetical protein